MEGKVWELVNRERRSRKRINEEIKLEDWKEYFMGLLGGVEERVVRDIERENRMEGQDERDIEWEKVMKMIRRIKDGKVMGRDGVLSEAWKYGEEVE